MIFHWERIPFIKMSLCLRMDSTILTGMLEHQWMLLFAEKIQTTNFHCLLSASQLEILQILTNVGRKEEDTKVSQLRATFGPEVTLDLFLCGYFDATYLGYEAANHMDWVWEHRIQDFEVLGV